MIICGYSLGREIRLSRARHFARLNFATGERENEEVADQ